MDILGFDQEGASMKLIIRLNMETSEHSIYVNHSDVIGLVLRKKVFEAGLLPKNFTMIYVKKSGDSFDKLTKLGKHLKFTDRFSDHREYFTANGDATFFAFASNTLINTSVMLTRLRRKPGEYLKLEKPVANTEPFEDRYDQDALTLESLVSIPLKDLVIVGYGERGNYIISRKQLKEALEGARIDAYNTTYGRLPGMYGFLFPTRDGPNLNEERSVRVKKAYKTMKILLRNYENLSLPYINAFEEIDLEDEYENMSNEELNILLQRNMEDLRKIRAIASTRGFYPTKNYLADFMYDRSMNMVREMEAFLESVHLDNLTQRNFTNSALVEAIKEHKNQYIDILINNGADINTYGINDINEPFYVLAARYNNVVAMESLLVAGVNILIDEDWDFPVSTEAGHNGHSEILELMYKAGLDPILEEYVEEAHPRARPIMLKWIRMSEAERRAHRFFDLRYRRAELPRRFPRLVFTQPTTPESVRSALESRRSGSPIPLDLDSDDLPSLRRIGSGFSSFKNKYFN